MHLQGWLRSMANCFIDGTMQTYDWRQWRFESRTLPCCEVKTSGDMERLLTMQDFPSCCRQPSGVKTTIMIVDVQLAVGHCGSLHDVALALKEERVASLPAALHFAEAPPAGSKVGGVVMDKGNGQLDVIKYVTFNDKVSTREASKLIAGSAYVPFSRPGPWAVKKAIPILAGQAAWTPCALGHSDQMGGTSKEWIELSTWAPDNETLFQGVSFINDYTPETEANNEQHTWIVMNIKEDSDSPIAGWPEAKVRVMAQNKSKASTGVTLQRGFPLTDYFFVEPLLG